jgi:HK97 family phage portal protein
MSQLQQLGPIDFVRRAVIGWIAKRVDLEQFMYGDPWETSPQDNYDYAHGSFRIHPWVYTAVRVCAQSAARVPLKAYREMTVKDKVERAEVPGHPVARLLREPNAEMSGYRLIEATVAFKKLDGNAYWMLIRRGDNAAAEMLFCLRPDRVRIALRDNGSISGYLYRVGHEEIPIEPRDMIHHRQFSATQDHFGMGDLQAAINTIKDDFEVRKYNYNYFRNSAIPRGALVTDSSVSNTEFKRISARWLRAHGGTDYAHKIAVFEKGMKWQDIGMKPQDMDFLSKAKINRNEIGSVFGVPPNKMNDFDSGKWNSESQERQFMHDTIEPQLMEIADTTNLNMWKISGRVRSVIEPIKTEFDTSQVPALKRERQEMEKAENESIKIGRRTINEVRQSNSMEPTAWGDTYWKAANLIDVNTGAPGLDSATGATSLDVTPSGGVHASGAPLVITSVTPEDMRRVGHSSYWIKQDAFERMVRGFFVRQARVQQQIILGRLAEFDRMFLDVSQRRPPRSEWEIESVMFDLEQAIEQTGDKYAKLSEAMVKAGGDRAFEVAQVGGMFDLQDPNVTAYVREHTERYAKKVNTTTWKNMRGALAEMAKEGASTNEMANRVDTYFKKRRGEKFRIARTEASSALNGGLNRGYKQSQVVETKIWLNAGDDHVRDSHWLTEDEVGVDQVFRLDNGVTLEFPGDPGGPVEEIVECRCTTMPGKMRKD